MASMVRPADDDGARAGIDRRFGGLGIRISREHQRCLALGHTLEPGQRILVPATVLVGQDIR